MRRILLAAVIVFMCFSTQGFAATLIDDNFDSYTAGLIPPAPWSVNEYDGSVKVNNSIYSSSPNSVAVTVGEACNGNPYFMQVNSGITGTGTYEAYLRSNNVSHETLVMASTGTGSGDHLGYWISLGGPASFGIPAGHLAYYDGTLWHDIMAISNDTWYHVKIEVNVPSAIYDIYVDDMVTPIVTGASFRDTTLTDLITMGFVAYCEGNPNPPTPGVDYAYVDNVIVSDPTAVPTMTEWGMIIFAALAGLGAVYGMRRQKRAKN
jgi:hypothetical protein